MNFKRILSFFQKQTKPYLLANYIPTVHTFSIIESETKQNLWNLSLKSYDEHEYFAGIDYILLYLQNSFNEFKKEILDESIYYRFVHGSCLIEILVYSNLKVHVFSNIGIPKVVTPQLFRFALEENQSLHFSNYALDKQYLVLHNTFFLNDINPYFIFYSIQEIAIRSNANDDVLRHMHQLFYPTITFSTERTIYQSRRYKTFQSFITPFSKARTFENDYDKLLYASRLYTIHFLLAPQGFFQQSLASIFTIEDAISLLDKTALDQSIQYLHQVHEYEFYDVYYTFLEMETIGDDTLQLKLSAIFNHINWYFSNDPTTVIPYCIYSVGSLLRQFNTHPYHLEFFLFYLRLIHVDILNVHLETMSRTELLATFNQFCLFINSSSKELSDHDSNETVTLLFIQTLLTISDYDSNSNN